MMISFGPIRKILLTKDILLTGENAMDVEKIVWSKEVTEEQKEGFKQHLAWHAKQQERLCVIYHPNCGCSIDSFVVLDRFPMSEKIIACQCPECKNYCTMEISD